MELRELAVAAANFRIGGELGHGAAMPLPFAMVAVVVVTHP